MPRYNHYVSSFSVTIQLVIDGSAAFYDALQEHPFWHEYIPGLSHTNKNQPSATWYITEDTVLEFNQTDRAIRAGIDDTKKVVIIIESELEHLRQERSLYTLHGTVIVHSNRAVALIGNLSGIGKTTLAAFAARHEWTWIVDEKFTISNGKVIGGTRGILNDEKTKKAASASTPTNHEVRHPIALFCQPIVTTEKILTKFDASYEKKLWILNDEMTRDIRQVNGVIDLSHPLLQSQDTDANSAARLRATVSLADSIPLVYLRGPADLMLTEIEALIS